jgi:hypothetical protein
MWGVHGFATEKEGNLYTAEVRTGRVQKYTPCKGCKSRFARRQAWRAFGRSGALFWKEWEAGFWLSTLSTGPAFPQLFFLRPKGTRWPIPASGLEKGDAPASTGAWRSIVGLPSTFLSPLKM